MYAPPREEKVISADYQVFYLYIYINVGTADDDVTSLSLCSTTWVATHTLRRHQLSCVARQRLAQLIVGAGSCRLQGLHVDRFLLFLPLCVSSKSAL